MFREGSITGNKEYEDFISQHNIDAEGLQIIEALSMMPQKLVLLEMHNFFSYQKEYSTERLEKLKKETTDETKHQLYLLFYDFCKKYGWKVSHSLVRLIEGEI